jgi:hypothetical protein
MANQAAVGKPYKNYNVALTTTSAASAQPISVGIRMIRVYCTAGAMIAIGPSGVAATATNAIYIAAGTYEYFLVGGNGTEYVAGILNSGTATLNIVEMTQ